MCHISGGAKLTGERGLLRAVIHLLTDHGRPLTRARFNAALHNSETACRAVPLQGDVSDFVTPIDEPEQQRP